MARPRGWISWSSRSGGRRLRGRRQGARGIERRRRRRRKTVRAARRQRWRRPQIGPPRRVGRRHFRIGRIGWVSLIRRIGRIRRVGRIGIDRIRGRRVDPRIGPERRGQERSDTDPEGKAAAAPAGTAPVAVPVTRLVPVRTAPAVASVSARAAVPAVAAVPAGPTAVPALASARAAATPALARRGRPQRGHQQESDGHDQRGPDQPSPHGFPSSGAHRGSRRLHYTPGRRNQSSSASRVLRNASVSQGISWRAK